MYWVLRISKRGPILQTLTVLLGALAIPMHSLVERNACGIGRVVVPTCKARQERRRQSEGPPFSCADIETAPKQL